MRPTLLALLATAAIVAASGKSCAQNRIEELAQSTSCGCPKAISKCLGAEVDLERWDKIQECYVFGGCSETDALAQAVLFAHQCEESAAGGYEVADETDEREDLKRRQNGGSSAATATDGNSADSTTAPKTTAKNTVKNTAKTTATPSSTEVATTPEPSASVTDAAAPSTTSSDSITSSISSTTTGSTTGPLACSATTTVQTSICSVSAGKTQSCWPTVTELVNCASGYLCFTPTPGANSCMKKDNTVPVSGGIIASAFAFGIAGAFIAVIVSRISAQKRSRQNKLTAQMMASSINRPDIETANAFSGSRNPAMASDANLPLIAPGGIRSDQQDYNEQDYYDQGHTSSTAPPPRLNLHQGLGALGEERY